MTTVNFDRIAAVYDGFMGQWTHRFMPALLRAVDVRPGHRVLDLATGTGESAVRLGELVVAGGAVVGTDISVAMLVRARAKVDGHPIRLVAADGQALACRDGVFDRVVCQLGLMFFPDPVAGVREARRVLRPGGRFGALVWSVAERVPWFSVLSGEMLRHFPERRDELFATSRLGDPARLEDVVRQAGLGDVRVTTDVQQMEFASFDDYWAHVEAGAIRAGQLLRELPAATVQTVREQVRAGMARFSVGGRLVLPIETLTVVGTR